MKGKPFVSQEEIIYRYLELFQVQNLTQKRVKKDFAWFWIKRFDYKEICRLWG